jgi:hypothetical protein
MSPWRLASLLRTRPTGRVGVFVVSAAQELQRERPRDAAPSFKLEICSIGLGGIVGNEGCTRVKS